MIDGYIHHFTQKQRLPPVAQPRANPPDPTTVPLLARLPHHLPHEKPALGARQVQNSWKFIYIYISILQVS